MKSAIRHLQWLYRSQACHYPGFFNWRHRQTIMLRIRLGLLHEPDFSALTKLNLTTDSLFVDIGANHGQSIGSFRSLFPGCTIISFEPNPIAFRYAERALRNTARQISPLGLRKNSIPSQAFNVALGAATDTMELYIPTCCGIECDQYASVGPRDWAELANLMKSIGFRFATRDNIEFERTTVPIKTLDEFNLAPDFIKIDVEGNEPAVLAGAMETLRRSTPILMIEWGHRPEIFSLLRPLGYSRFVYDENKFLPSDDRPAANSFYFPAGD
jgi:FkbM family methyltransferase